VIERNSFRKTVLTTVALCAVLLNTVGCSLFSPRVAAGGPENGNFRQTASVSSNPIPLPVEIVNDISTIASGGNIPQEGVWRPAYPEADFQDPQTGAKEPSEDNGKPAAGTVQEASRTTGTVSDGGGEETQKTKSNGKHRRVASTGGKTETYKVRRGDTLMKISFEKYGNIYRWREIYDSNKSKIANLNRLTAGTLLTIQGVEYIVIERNGTPYLIRRGDTLVRISNNLYNTPTEWKSIWKNNRQLIHDPNKIYAGFTLYYVPKKSDEVPKQVRQISNEKPGPKPRSSLPGKLSPSGKRPVVPSTTAPTGAAAVRSLEATAAVADGAWTASPATPVELPAEAPAAKP
jgi:hypothetical protein